MVAGGALRVVTGGIDPEIGRLVGLAQTGSPESRSELYLSVAGLMQSRGQAVTPSERSLLTAIMGQLTKQVEMQVRHALADRIAELSDAPHELILLLANDRIEVAQIVLAKSALLNEGELIDLVTATSHLHQRVIAGRPDVTPRIAAALAESSAMDVLIELVRNQRARIASDTLERLAERSRGSIDLQHDILKRAEIGADLAKRMCSFVTEALHGFITQRFDVDPKAIKRSLALASADAHARLTQASGPERLVSKLHAAGQLKAGFAVKALGQGQLEVFEHAIAKLVGMPHEAVTNVMKAGDAKLLALICQAVGIDRSVFTTLFSQAEILRGRSGIIAPIERLKVEEIFKTLNREEARQQIIRKAA